MDLTFSGSISNVNSDNPENFVKLARLEVAFPKTGFAGFRSVQTGPVMSIFFYNFVPLYGYQHLVKIS